MILPFHLLFLSFSVDVILTDRYERSHLRLNQKEEGENEEVEAIWREYQLCAMEQ